MMITRLERREIIKYLGKNHEKEETVFAATGIGILVAIATSEWGDDLMPIIPFAFFLKAGGAACIMHAFLSAVKPLMQKKE